MFLSCCIRGRHVFKLLVKLNEYICLSRVSTFSVVSCDFSRPGENAVIVSSNNSFLDGDILNFQCEQNSINLSGEEEIRCEANGTWSGVPLTCGKIVSCGSKSAGQNATVISTGNTFTEGDVIKFQCVGGKKEVSGQKEITCLTAGKWDGEALTCSACRLFSYIQIWIAVYLTFRQMNNSSWQLWL